MIASFHPFCAIFTFIIVHLALPLPFSVQKSARDLASAHSLDLVSNHKPTDRPTHPSRQDTLLAPQTPPHFSPLRRTFLPLPQQTFLVCLRRSLPTPCSGCVVPRVSDASTCFVYGGVCVGASRRRWERERWDEMGEERWIRRGGEVRRVWKHVRRWAWSRMTSVS